MMKRIGIAGVALVAVLALSGLVVSSASALPPNGCYKVDKGKGDWKKAAAGNKKCEEETGILEGEYVEAEPITQLGELWCVRILPAPNDVGAYQSGTCETLEEHGPYTSVTIPAAALPLWTPASTGTLKSGTGSLLLEGKSFACAKDVGLLGAGTRLGTFDVNFTSCLLENKICKSLGEALASSEILVTGEWHLVSLLSNRKHYLIWLLLSPTDTAGAVHIECEALEKILILVWGNVLGLINGGGTNYLIAIHRTSGGAQELTEFGNNSVETVKAELKGKIGKGVTREAFEEAGEVTLTMATSTTINET